MQLRYVGGAESVVMDTPYKFSRYGQLVEVPEGLGQRMLAELPVLTPEEFSTVGHTDEELKKFGDFASHRAAPVEFVERRKKAWEMLHERGTDKRPAAVRAPAVVKTDNADRKEK